MSDNKEVKMKRAGLLLFLVHPSTMDIYFRCMVPSNAKYGGNSPQVPKGRIEDGDTERETAIKECCEEAGLLPHNLRWAIPLTRDPKLKISFYIGTVNSASDFGESDYETKWTGWVNYNTQYEHLRETQLHIFDEAAEFIREHFIGETKVIESSEVFDMESIPEDSE